MKVSALALSVAVGASLLAPMAPARAGILSNLLGTAAEVVQPGTGGVVRSGWGLLRGVGRTVIPRRRQSPPASTPSASSQPTPAKTAPTADLRPAVGQPVQALAADRQPSKPAAHRTSELTVQELLLDPPPPPGTAHPPPATGRP